jgi:N6-adenosine-specific RNA methylase IME4
VIDLPPGPFGTILADPPWSFRTRSAKGLTKSPQAHYECMSMLDLAEMPIADLAAPDCALFMWATFPMLPHALHLMGQWGFRYKSGGAWAKRSPKDKSWAFGTGYIFRGAAEVLLVGTRGTPKWQSRSERNLWVAPIQAHSVKPDCVHEAIERLSLGPRLELFARRARPGWTVWGDQLDEPRA